jgi:uncharacterized repeat protein (TIGR01451 family)
MAASILLTKQGTPNVGNNGFADVGETIAYTFTFANTSTKGETFTSLTLNDSKLGITDLAIPLAATLTPGNSITLSLKPGTAQPFTYTLTASDLDQGTVVNSATVKGTFADGTTTSNFTGIGTTGYPINASLKVSKTAGVIQDKSGPGGTADGISGNAGDVIIYDFEVINTSPRTAKNLTLTDEFTSIGATPVSLTSRLQGLTDADADGVADDLAVGATARVTLPYTITQDDVNAGLIENTARAAGTTFSGNTIRGSSGASVDLPRTANISLEKTASAIGEPDAPLADGFDSPGDPIIYTYVVKNTGTTTLTNVKLVDDNGTPGNTSDDPQPSIPLKDAAGNIVTTLAPGATATGTYTGKLTVAAIAALSLRNIAVVTADSPVGNVTDIANAEVIPGIAKIALIKDLANPSQVFTTAGTPVDYLYRVTNTGTVALTNVVLQDDNGTPGNSADDKLSIDLFKINDNGTPNILTDDIVTTVALGNGPLAPGESAAGRYTGKLTQVAINDGKLTNIAKVQGTAPKGGIVRAQDTETITPLGNPKIDLVKDAAPASGLRVGDQVVFTYKVTNSGNVDLFNLSLKDDNATPSFDAQGAPIPGTSLVNLADDFSISLVLNPTQDTNGDGLLDKLAVGQSVTVTQNKTLTAADLVATSRTNLAVVQGFDSKAKPVFAADPATITFAPPKPPHVSLEKSAHVDLGADDCLNEGDIITYTFTVTNTGEIKIDAVQISDILPGLSQIKFDKPFSVLNPGDVITATATYAITEQNLCDRFVENFATVYGNPLGGKPNDTSDDGVAKDGLIVRFDNGNWWTEAVDVAPPVIDLGGNGSTTPNPGTPSTPTNPPVVLPGTTTTSGNTIYGTAGNDVINPGGNVDYMVYANEGQNAIVTGNGQDALYGGSGLDAFVAGDGDNTIYANEGRNIVITGNGKNTVYGGSVGDAIFTGSGDDLIYANEGDNYVSAGAGNNQVYVGGGVDYVVLTAGAGSSKVYNFNAAQDTFGLAGINAADITVEQIGSGGYFTRISAGTDVLAELDGVHVTKSQLKLETSGNAGNSSVSFLVDPLRSDLRNQLVAAGMPAATVNALFA